MNATWMVSSEPWRQMQVGAPKTLRVPADQPCRTLQNPIIVPYVFQKSIQNKKSWPYREPCRSLGRNSLELFRTPPEPFKPYREPSQNACRTLSTLPGTFPQHAQTYQQLFWTLWNPNPFEILSRTFLEPCGIVSNTYPESQNHIGSAHDDRLSSQL